MAVRKQCNRYKTEPFGTDFDQVVKKAKAFYKTGVFGICKYKDTYTTFRPSTVFADPKDTIYFKYTKNGCRGSWISYRADRFD